MYLISAEGYKSAGVYFLKTGKIWANMKNVQDGLGVKNMPDLILKEIYGIYETKNITKEQIKKYILLRFIKLILIFMSIVKRKKIQVDENGCKYIFFRIDFYFSEYLLAVEVDEKGHTDRDVISEKKRQEVLEKKKLGCKLIRINMSKEGYNADFKASRVQTFINNLKNRKLKKSEKE